MDNAYHLKNIVFGKHKNKTFAEVYEDKAYTTWCMSKADNVLNNTNFTAFIDYCKRRDVLENKKH